MINIRKADENDIIKISALFAELHEYHCAIFPEAHKMPDDSDFFIRAMSKIISDGENIIFVNDDGGILNAYAVIKIFDDIYELKPERKVCYIDCFAVSEKHRRSGVGTALFEHICKFAQENSCTHVQLGVNSVNENARRFYEKMGLVPRTVTMTKNI